MIRGLQVVAVFAVSYLLGVLGYAAFDVFVLGHFDPKWGDRLDNVQFGFVIVGLWFLPYVLVGFLLSYLLFARRVQALAARAAVALSALSSVVATVTAFGVAAAAHGDLPIPEHVLSSRAALLIPGVLAAALLFLLVTWHRFRQSV